MFKLYEVTDNEWKSDLFQNKKREMKKNEERIESQKGGVDLYKLNMYSPAFLNFITTIWVQFNKIPSRFTLFSFSLRIG